MRAMTFAVILVVVLLATAAAERRASAQFEILPAEHNTYTVTFDLHNLECVKNVGTAGQCAVTNQSADEGGYPWTKVKCRAGDRSVTTFAWSLKENRPVSIFEAPPALSTSPNLYPMDVRLGRTCMKVSGAGK